MDGLRDWATKSAALSERPASWPRFLKAAREKDADDPDEGEGRGRQADELGPKEAKAPRKIQQKRLQASSKEFTGGRFRKKDLHSLERTDDTETEEPSWKPL